MDDPMQGCTLEPQDAERWEALAVLLGALGTPAISARFASLYRREAGDPEAESALTGLCAAATALWARDHADRTVPELDRVA